MYNIIKGIYLITRKVAQNDGEPLYYIGQAKNIFERFQEHCENGCQSGIDAAINKYGITSFSFEILEIVKRQADRDKREKAIIKEYIEKYRENMLYNRQTGGKQGYKQINTDRQKDDNDIRRKIREIFKQDMGYSVDLIAEHFHVDGLTVIKIRKPLLKQNGLKYDNSKKQVVYMETGEIPDNWRGGVLTKKQVALYNKNKNMELDELANLMKISITDLKVFKEEYEGHEQEYKVAEMRCNLKLLK